MGNTVIQLRNDTASNWTTNNPTLAQSEMGIETDTNKFKFGDGSTAWNSLSYAGGSAGAFKYGQYTLSANQTSNLTADDHIEFDTYTGSLGGLSTGSGQQNGIITLPANKTYKITFRTRCIYSGTSGIVGINLYNRNTSSILAACVSRSVTNTGNVDTSNVIIHVLPVTTSIDIDIRFAAPAAFSQIPYLYTSLLVEEYGGY